MTNDTATAIAAAIAHIGGVSLSMGSLAPDDDHAMGVEIDIEGIEGDPEAAYAAIDLALAPLGLALGEGAILDGLEFVTIVPLDARRRSHTMTGNTAIASAFAFAAAKKEFGSVKFQGVEYALTSHADHTSRLLPGGFTNYNDAADGEAYDFELSAPAIDAAGNHYRLYWMFEGIKGEDDPDLDSYDYSDVDRVVEAD